MEKLDFWRLTRLLAQNPDQRSQDGELVAKALYLCLQSLTAGAACHAAFAEPTTS